MEHVITDPALKEAMNQLEIIDEGCEAIAQRRNLSPAAVEHVTRAIQRGVRRVKALLLPTGKVELKELDEILGLDELVGILDSLDVSQEVTFEMTPEEWHKQGIISWERLNKVKRENPILYAKIETLLDQIRVQILPPDSVQSIGTAVPNLTGAQ